MPSSGPWNDWYHVTVSTYGAWLPGDGRGWRSRHHREHVDGDYTNPPPPGKYDTLHRAATKSMKRRPIVLPAEIRATVMKTLRDALQHYGVTIAIIAVAAKHAHVLAQFGENIPATGVAGLCDAHQRKDGLDARPRYLVGKSLSFTSHTVKRYVTDLIVPGDGSPRALCYTSICQPGGLWAASPDFAPIGDQQHFTNALSYIADHGSEGAAVWTRRRG
ncbi:MAG: hypothetical protein IIA64_10910 [Planctomycetes bacterium]|nr:hypothetical protein [Planctomycetota bacterium]